MGKLNVCVGCKDKGLVAFHWNVIKIALLKIFHVRYD